MKKWLAAMLAVMMVLSMAACAKKEQEPSSGPETSSSLEESPVPPEAPSSPEEAGEVDARLTEVYEAMKEAYGENYLPSMQLDDVMLSEVYGINMDNVESFIAEAPMISAHVDTFIAIKAKEGKADEVEAELNAYRDDQINNAMQYPMNEAKVKASQVVRKDDYVFFVMLGQIPDETVSDTAAFAKEQIQIGLDKIEELFR